MRLALTLITALAVVLLVTGHPLTALTAYLGAGGLWTLYDLRRPLHSRPIGHSTLIGSAILFLLWPFRMAYDIVWYLQTIKRGERFVVHGQGESLKFASWSAAKAHAVRFARESGEVASITDTLRYARQFGKVGFKTWWFEPDGSVRTLPRSLY